MPALPQYPLVRPRLTARLSPAVELWAKMRRAALRGLSEMGEHTSLASRFGVAAAFVIFNGMAILGGWVTSRIEQGVLQNAAHSSALLLGDYLDPGADELARMPALSPDTIKVIDSALKDPALSSRLISLTLWEPDGTVAYATNKSLIGRKGALPPEVAAAFSGDVRTHYAPEAAAEKGDAQGEPVIDVYLPLRAAGEVVAVAEFHERARHLEHELAHARHQTWLIVAALSLAMFGLLFSMVYKGSRLIERQKRTLVDRIAYEVGLNRQNTLLRSQLQQASHRNSEINEQLLRRIGSDLNAGPSQHLALALLRLDELVPQADDSPIERSRRPAGDAKEVIRRELTEALREIRHISSGLALPELQAITPGEVLGIAAYAHERATGNAVEMRVGTLPAELPLSYAICLFRFAQHGLNNAYRHGRGEGQAIRADADGAAVVVEIVDRGPGVAVDRLPSQVDRLGLECLRHRVEMLGGTLDICSAEGSGTRLRIRLPIAAGQDGDAT